MTRWSLLVVVLLASMGNPVLGKWNPDNCGVPPSKYGKGSLGMEETLVERQLYGDDQEETDLADPFADHPRRQRRSAIRGGQITHASQFPFVVGITSLLGTGLSLCTGALISPNYVLSAAHCFKKGAQVHVHAGVDHVDHDTDYVPGSVRLHPHYRMGAPDGDAVNDLAVVRLARPAPLLETRYPLCVSGATPPPDQPLQSVGYGGHPKGRDGPVQHDDTLRAVPVRTRPCAANLDASFLCSGNGTRGTESGDSGGPLISRKDGRFVSYGTLSMGVDADLPEFKYDIYTKNAHFCKWIKKQTKGETVCHNY